MKSRRDILEQVGMLDAKVQSMSPRQCYRSTPYDRAERRRGYRTWFVAIIDDPAQFRRSASADAYLGLTLSLIADANGSLMKAIRER